MGEGGGTRGSASPRCGKRSLGGSDDDAARSRLGRRWKRGAGVWVEGCRRPCPSTSSGPAAAATKTSGLSWGGGVRVVTNAATGESGLPAKFGKEGGVRTAALAPPPSGLAYGVTCQGSGGASWETAHSAVLHSRVGRRSASLRPPLRRRWCQKPRVRSQTRDRSRTRRGVSPRGQRSTSMVSQPS